MGTVYRNLAQLSGVSHDYGNMAPHQHFVCNKCKAIIDCHAYNQRNIDNLKKTQEFYIQKVDIIFSGLCQ